MTQPLKPNERRDALTTTEANLHWLTIDRHRERAIAVLLDGEMQSAIIAAQNPAGATRPTEGSTGYSDPTGMAAIQSGGTELRALEVRRCWLATLEEIHEAVATLHAITAEVLGLPAPTPTRGLTLTVARLHWLTVVPANRAMTIHHTAISADALGEYDHAIRWACDRSYALRSGSMTNATGKRIPSVHGVLEAARKVTATAPPAPVQKPLDECRICSSWRTGTLAVSRLRCEQCAAFQGRYHAKPTEAIVRYWDATGRNAVPPGMILEAQATSKRKAKAS